MKTIEGNKLIAEFMGERPSEKPIFDMNGMQIGSDYHSSWDWLMPVVEKIRSNCFNVTIADMGCEIDIWDDSLPEDMLDSNWEKPIRTYGGRIFINSNIESVWNASIEFINWYNAQKQ